MLPILYTAELDLDESDVESFMNWFAFRHVPDLQASGFPGCACYRATEGDMNLFDLYELPGVEVFQRPRYAGMGQRDSYAAPILAARRDKSNTVYTQRMIASARGNGADLVDADWISIVRFDASAATAEAFAAALAAKAPRLLELGAFSVRFARRGPHHPSYSSHRPEFLAIAEWPSEPVAEASLGALLGAMDASDISHLKPFTGYRVYPWPDDASLRK